MKSEIIKEAEHLYESGNIQEAFRYYAGSLWRGEENETELLSVWLSDENIIDRAGEEAVCAFIACILFAIDRCEELLREHLWSLCHEIFDRITVCADRQDTSDRYVAECNLYRHEKKPEKALEVILRGLKQKPTISRYTFTGLTYLDLEKAEEAERYIELGVHADPGNASAYNDLGDYYFKKRHWVKAGECYYKVLEAGDYNDCGWAEPSWIFCCFMASGEPCELERLLLCAAADIGNGRAKELCQAAAFETLKPNVDYLDSSSESIINAVRSMRKEGTTSGVVRCATTCQETASSINAVRLALEQICGKPPAFEMTAGKAQNPPLDERLDQEGIVWWKYPDINTPLAALERPSDYVSSFVGELAATDFSLKTWYEAAEKYAEKLSDTQCVELYGVMVFPPKQKEERFFAEDWLFRVQFAAVCILARISFHELNRICKGQLDWPIIPAFTLAAWLSSQDVSYARRAEEILEIVRKRISKENYCFFEYAYTCAAYLLPGKDEGYYRKLWQRRQSLLEE